jgi:peptidoglycan hydrolase-like protein with peptidoglycan-binding domain
MLLHGMLLQAFMTIYITVKRWERDSFLDIISREVVMYRINDRASAIKNIQSYLRAIFVGEINIVPNGVYDDKTRLAVLEFQRNNGLEPNGVVDLLTYELLYSSYSEKQIEDRVGKRIDLPFYPGDYSDEMREINKMLSSLLDYYRIDHRVTENGFYSKETSEAVKNMRKIYLMKDVDLVDEMLYSRMLLEYGTIE